MNIVEAALATRDQGAMRRKAWQPGRWAVAHEWVRRPVGYVERYESPMGGGWYKQHVLTPIDWSREDLIADDWEVKAP